MTSGYDSLLRRILPCWDSLSEREKSIAMNVVDWYEGVGATRTDRREIAVVEAIWAAARDELGERAELLRTLKRDLDLNDVRFVMYRLVHELLPSVPKLHYGEVLGIRRHHASILNALNKAEDFISSDPAFRSLYRRMLRRTNNYLKTD